VEQQSAPMSPDGWEKVSFISSLLWVFFAGLVITFVPNTNGFERGQVYVGISIAFSLPVVANLYRVHRSITLAGLGLFAGAAGLTPIIGIYRGIRWLIQRQKQPVLKAAKVTETGKKEEDWEKEKSQA
jgi:hypothetical protein